MLVKEEEIPFYAATVASAHQKYILAFLNLEVR